MKRGEHDIGILETASWRKRHLVSVAPPHSVATDLDLDRFVTRLDQSVPDRGGRSERDLVFRGPAASEHRDPEPVHGVVGVVGVVEVVGVVGVVGVVEGEGDAVYCPTTIVTVLPFLAELPPPGDWRTTTPFLALFVTFLEVCVTLNPAA
jgi:hypothetical protein